jgi:Zn-dependent peptidase ImmA (M78 family)
MQKDNWGQYLSLKDIEAKANQTRKQLGLGEKSVFNVVGVVEKRLCRIIPDFSLCTKSELELGNIEAYMDYNPTRMVGRADVVLLARYGEPRFRFTIAHEVGHAVLHPNQIMPRKGIDKQRYSSIPRAYSVEAQADTFAAFFLMSRAITNDFDDPQSLARFCKVSEAAAEIHMRMLELWPKKSEKVIRGFQELLTRLRAETAKKR